MTCASCQNALEAHLFSMEGVAYASVSLLTHKVKVSYRPQVIGIRQIIEQVEAIGFRATYEAQSEKNDIRAIMNKAVETQRNKFIFSLVLLIPIIVLTWIVQYAYPPFVTMIRRNGVPLFVYLSFAFATIIQVGVGYQFYINSYKSLKHKSANMDVLIALGTTAAYAYGFIRMCIGYSAAEVQDTANFQMMVSQNAHMFEMSSVLITIILLGKFLETLSKKRTVDQLSRLASLKVSKAVLLEGTEGALTSRKEREIEVDLLMINDFVKIYPGQGVPVDGLVVHGRGVCNESMLTGEARPVQKEVGSRLFGGSLLTQGSVFMKVTKTAENSSINQIIKLVENAQNARAPIQAVADRISKYFVPFVIALSCVAWLVWFSYAYSRAGFAHVDLQGSSRFQFAFNFGISTLVIACPCALGLATPTAVMVGTGIAASLGILIKGGDVLEKISSVTMVVFDKTGTLTSGAPAVQDLVSVREAFKVAEACDDKDFLLFVAYLAEKGSEHPLAKAVIKKIESLIPSKIEEL